MTSTLPVIIALLIGLSFWPESAWADTSHEILQAKVQSLIEKLDNQEEHERRLAAESLGDLGEGARPAIPPLVRASVSHTVAKTPHRWAMNPQRNLPAAPPANRSPSAMPADDSEYPLWINRKGSSVSNP